MASSEPQAAGQARPEMPQRIAASGWPLLLIAARNDRAAPSSTPIALGLRAMATSLVRVSVAVANFAGSLLLVAVICIAGAGGRFAGAV